MRTITPKFKELMASGNARVYKINVNMTLADNTTLTLTEDDIWSDSFSIETASSGTSSFDIGTAVIGKCKFSINNFDESFSQYDFFNATATVWVGLEGDLDNNNTQVYYRMGFFTVDEPVYSSSLISLELLDNMWKFDVPLSSVNLTFPITIRNAFVAICQYCGVTLGTQTFHGDSFTIEVAPEKDMNCREFLQYCAMIGCNFCVINDTGALELKWYNTSAIPSGSDLDGGSFRTTTTPYSDGDTADGGTFAFNDGDNYDGGTFTDNADCVWFTRNMQATFGTDVITITGVKFIINETAYSIGSAGYVLELENPLVTASNVNSVLNLIWDVLEGFTLRTFNLTTASDLSAEIGDCCILRDYKGNNIYSWITLNTFKFANHVVQCNAVSPTRTLEKRYSKTVSAAVEATRKQTENIISDYDLAVQVMNEVAVNAMGAYINYEDLSTGGRVYYLSNMPITKSGNTCSFQSGSTVFKRTGDGLYVSTNGGQTWQNGYNAQTGQLIVNVLNAIGISAEWIKTGTLTVGGSGVGNPSIVVKDSSNNTVVDINQNGLTAHAGVIRTADNTFYVDMATNSVRIGAGTGIYDPNANYSGSYVPTNSNYPASSWTDAEKANHIGETFTDTSTKKTYIYKVTPAAIPESNHPYGTNEDAYYRFDCPSGWSKAVLTFDAQCETEGSNYDYLDFYMTGYDSAIYRYRLQGTEFAGKTYIIDLTNSHTFYLRWHADGSVTKWGWKFTVSDSGTGTSMSALSEYDPLPSASWTLINLASGGTYEWVESTITGYIDAKSGEVNLTQEEVYDILTNGGQNQGLYLSNGTVYINAQYMTSNAITIGGSQYSQKTYLQIRDSSDNEIGRWDKDGIVANAGRFGKLHVLQSDGNTFLKYVTTSGRVYIDKAWAQGQLKSYSLITEYRLNPYKEGWIEDGYINVTFNMPVSRTSYQTEVQCIVSIYKHTYGNMQLERTVQLLYNGTVKSSSGSSGSDDSTVVIDEDGNVVENLLGYTFDHTFGANSDEWYQLKFKVTKRSSSYANGTTTLVVDDNKNGSGFILRETSDHKATCTGKFDGEISGQGAFDSVSVGDYISCENGDIVTNTNSSGSIMSYDGIRVWSGAADFGDSNNKMQIFYDDICKESGGTDYYAQFSSSDERVKEDIEDLDHELSKNLIDGTRTREFTFVGSEGRHYGVIAQEARELLNNLGEEDSQLEYIAGRPDGKIPNQRNVNYNEYIPHLINYVKDLRAEIENLKAEIKELKGE